MSKESDVQLLSLEVKLSDDIGGVYVSVFSVASKVHTDPIASSKKDNFGDLEDVIETNSEALSMSPCPSLIFPARWNNYEEGMESNNFPTDEGLLGYLHLLCSGNLGLQPLFQQ